ncbi:unnamed protein product, partial [Staurois parvus]
MNLQYRVCQAKHVLLLFSGLFLGVSQILLVEGSVTGSSTRADLKSTPITVTNSTSIHDFQSQNTPTEKPTDQATSETTNGSVLPVFHTVSEAPDSNISETTSDELFPINSTTKGATTPRQHTETTG